MAPMTTPKLTIGLNERRPGFFDVSLSGRLDSATFELLEKRLDVLTGRRVHALHFEMGGLDYISSLGLRAVMKAMVMVKQQDGTIGMSNLQPQIKKVFEIAQMLPTETVFASVEEADRYFDAMQRKELAKQS